MKRTELKRTGGLRRVSPKRAKQDAACDHRKEFRAEFAGTLCWLCMEEGVADPQVGTEDHHIAGRNHALRHHWANQAWLCAASSPYDHHGRVTKYSVREMFEVKLKYDPQGYDPAVVALVYRGKSGRRDVP